MDILNFISWIKGGRVVTTVNPAQTLLPVGLKDNRRDDGYLAGAISVQDFVTEISCGFSNLVVEGTGKNSSMRCGVNNTASGSYSTVFGRCNTVTSKDGSITGGRCNTASGYSFTSVTNGCCNTSGKPNIPFTATASGLYNCYIQTIPTTSIDFGQLCFTALSINSQITNFASNGSSFTMCGDLTSPSVLGCCFLSTQFFGICGGGTSYGGANCSAVSCVDYNALDDTTLFCFTPSIPIPIVVNSSYSVYGNIVNLANDGSSITLDTDASAFVGCSSQSGYAIYASDGTNSGYFYSVCGSAVSVSYNSCANTSTFCYSPPIELPFVVPGSCYTQIINGNNNTISGSYESTIINGRYNSICKGRSFIGGGNNNTIDGGSSFIGGGNQNTISANYSTILLGSGNNISCTSGNATILNGRQNTISGYQSLIASGNNNVVSDERSVILNGRFQTISNKYSTISGGTCNTITGRMSTISGGYCNTVSGCCAAVVSGRQNTASGAYSIVAGGLSNTASGGRSVVSGGFCNRSIGSFSPTIGGGQCNTSSGYRTSTVGGGLSNTASSSGSTISGGYSNVASGFVANVGSGLANTASAFASTISGGRSNTASGSYSGILGGNANIASCRCSFIVGSNITTDRICATFVNNLSIKDIPSSDVGLPTKSLYYDSATCVVKIVP